MQNNITKNFNKKNGFTLIEILVVILVIGILAGITVSVINPRQLQSRTRDATRLATLSSVVGSINNHRAAEGRFPTADEVADATSRFRRTYVTHWPQGIGDDGEPDSAFNLEYTSDSDGFIVLVPNSAGEGCYKFATGWSEVRDCGSCNPDASCAGGVSLPPVCDFPCTGPQPPDGCLWAYVCTDGCWECSSSGSEI